MLPLLSSPTAGAHLAFIDGLGGAEMLLIFVIVLMLFGGDKLPEFARGLGKTMREFKKAASGVEEEFRRAMEEDERKRTAAATPTLPAGTSDPATSGYPEDGSSEYTGEPDPATLTPATTAPAGDAPGTPAAPPEGAAAPAATDAAAPAPAPAPEPAPAAKPRPVVSEDYP